MLTLIVLVWCGYITYKFFHPLDTTSTSTQKPYHNHCWNCHSEISGTRNDSCGRCGWYICEKCGSCGCGYH